MSYDAPFDGLKVIDLSQGIAGPYCAMLMAQYGAEVIKIEPEEGDWARRLGRAHGDHTAFSVIGNLGKKSVTLDLKNSDDCEALWRLLDSADVMFEGFRPGVIDRLGFGYEAVRVRNPRLLYVSISGFGQRGPLAPKPAMDPVLQAFTGFMVANADEQGTPHRTRPIIVDMTTALYAFQAVSAALYARRDESEGRRIEVSLMEAAANLQSVRMLQTHLEPNLPASANSPAGSFQCADGNYVFIVVVRQPEFVALCKAMDLNELAFEPRYSTQQGRFEHMEDVNRVVGERFLTKPADYWVEKLTEAGLQNERILTYQEFLEHPHVVETGFVAWLAQPGFEEPVPVTNVPGTVRLQEGGARTSAPVTGEHTQAVLEAHGVRKS